MFESALKHYDLPSVVNLPVQNFSEAQKSLLLYGSDNPYIRITFPDVKAAKSVSEGYFEGVYPILWRRLSEKGSLSKAFEPYFVECECLECHGERLNELSREAVVYNTRLPELVHFSLVELNNWVIGLEKSLQKEKQLLVNAYFLDLKTKILRIINVGLDYLTLDRQTMTLSGGELQRIKLAAALDSELSGVIYILDEPTVGLHDKDTEGLIQILKKLRDMGNTVIVIEHDPDVMMAADHIIDMGPDAGRYGGEIVGQGTLNELMKQATSITGSYYRKMKKFDVHYRTPYSWLEIKNAHLNNLNHLDVKLPMNVLCAITGVSGSGKTTLIFDVLAKQQSCDSIIGLDSFNQIITIEQAPLTRMKRSNVATYSSVYSEIRKLFADKAMDHGLNAKHFSFNIPGGRCENCQGLGTITSNLLFFKDVEVPCPICHGKQFNDEVLSIKYKGLNIHEVLHLSVDEAMNHFKESNKIKKILNLLHECGLGYLALAQSLTTLSAGEAQRLKLAKELNQNKKNNCLYLIDEPTAGLHPIDIENFLVLIQKLVDQGNTVIVVEHNLQFIQQADWVIDLGPKGGIHGGEIIAQGTPSAIIQDPASVTGKYLGGNL